MCFNECCEATQFHTDQAKNLLSNCKLQGVIRQTKDAFLYLSVSSDFVYKLYPLVSSKGMSHPPYFNMRKSVGAHISIIKSAEANFIGIDEFKEVGLRIPFSLRDVNTTNPESWHNMERVWYINVVSPQLEMIRKRYGLSELIDGHSFHITFACRRKK